MSDTERPDEPMVPLRQQTVVQDSALRLAGELEQERTAHRETRRMIPWALATGVLIGFIVAMVLMALIAHAKHA